MTQLRVSTANMRQILDWWPGPRSFSLAAAVTAIGFNTWYASFLLGLRGHASGLPMGAWGMGWPVAGIFFIGMLFAAAAIVSRRCLQMALLAAGMVGLAWVLIKYLPIVLLWPTHSYWTRMLIPLALALEALTALMKVDREMMEPPSRSS